MPLHENPTYGMTAELARWAAPQLTPSPVGPAHDPLPTGGEAVPVTYAFCALTPDFFPCAFTRAGLNAEGAAHTVLAAGHDAPITNPELIADWLLRF